LKAYSINDHAYRLTETLAANAAAHGVEIARGSQGERLIDAGASGPGSLSAGIAMAEICMGGLGTVTVGTDMTTPAWPWRLLVRSSHPVIACLSSQYAGWKLEHKDYFALGSGPARALAYKEEVLIEVGYRDTSRHATLVLETDSPPPAEIISTICRDCHVTPDDLTIIYAPTQSLSGSTQVVARVLEVALHKAHTLHFPLNDVVEGLASAPLCPPHPDFVTSMGRTNDAIIYGGQVHLFVKGDAKAAKELANSLPSRGSRDFGRPFSDVFKAFNGDFYAIDPLLFSPASVMVTALESGQTFRSGGVNQDLLNASFT
jgi:methenyltetrahydromethanopterin cyclohydrolase